MKHLSIKPSILPVICRFIPALFAISLAHAVPEKVTFNEDIRPILSDKCFACHGFDKNAREAELRLDTAEGAASVIKPGDPDKSELFQHITAHDPDEIMPPPETIKKLTDADRNLIRKWIEQGAEYESHWAYLKPVRHSSDKNAIDHFITKELKEQDLRASPPAKKWRLVRRLYQDLIGLPPTAQEMEEGLKMEHAQLIDHLLASPHYGEKMAIPWLDLVRYADSVGYHGDQLVTVSPYRDYVINSFNANKSFEEFTREQIAGDLLPNPTEEQLIASGYNRLNMTSEEGGAQAKEYLAKYAGDRVRTTSSVWLGSTLGCAECHDHKFDPYLTKDFYTMAAFFADLEEKGVYSARARPPQIVLYTDEEKARIAELDKAIPESKARIPKDAPKEHPERAVLKELEDEKKKVQGAALSMVISKAVKPRTVRVLARGNWMDDSGEIVLPAIPEFLGKINLPEGKERLTRLDLANWITSPENPLTARTFANRLWKQFYGSGISGNLDDLGNQGDWPMHPELLDWLALEFVESGWDIKQLVRTMVNSETYKQSSHPRSELREVDPYNQFFARQARFRLDAELVRDSALSISDLLVRDVGGRSVRPYQPEKYYQHLNFPRRNYQASKGNDQYRRGVYTHWQRTFLHPMMKSFDAPSREECAADRPSSNTPLQALVLLNDPTFLEAARVFSERILAEGGEDFQSRLTWAFQETVSRKPNENESSEMKILYEKQRARFEKDPAAAAEYLKNGDSPVSAKDPIESATWMSLSRVLFNLHEMIARY
jgi:hypothetical protein|tara:strand:- start:1588 stop:3912 length:2325 start_codon:yes stop_codon:yes gene_type:complete